MQIFAILFSALTLLAIPALAREHGVQRDKREISAIVIHTVGGPACVGNVVQFRSIQHRVDDALFWQKILKSAPVADAHFVIGRNGTKAEVIPVAQIANHTVGANEHSIGIELVHRGDGIEPFEEDQLLALIKLIKYLRKQYSAILIENIVAHSEVDQRTCTCAKSTYYRRQDPGANFPLERIKDAIRLQADSEEPHSALPRLTGKAHARDCTTVHRN